MTCDHKFFIAQEVRAYVPAGSTSILPCEFRICVNCADRVLYGYNDNSFSRGSQVAPKLAKLAKDIN